MKSEKSQIFLANALMELMRDKPYNKISVRDITQRAYVSRATFYNHFDSRDAVIQFLLEQAFSAFELSENVRQTAVQMVQAVSNASELLMRLQDQEMLHLALAFLEGIGDNAVLKTYQIRTMFYSAFGIRSRLPELTDAEIVNLICQTRAAGVAGNLQLGTLLQNKSVDRRAQKTVASLQNALNVLLQKQPLYQITISQLAETAGITRSSFYRHYFSVEHLVYDSLQCAFRTVLTHPEPCTLADALRIYTPYRTLFQATSASGKDMEVMDCLNRMRTAAGIPRLEEQTRYAALLDQGRNWCLAANHVTAILLYFENDRLLTIEDFCKNIQTSL